MSSIFLEEPGTLKFGAAQEMLGHEIATRVVQQLPKQVNAGIDIAKVAAGATSAIVASVGGGPLAVLGAVYAGAAAINGALNGFAEMLRKDIAKGWTNALEDLCSGLIRNADGRILAVYQPADIITLKRAQAYTSNKRKDGKIHKLETLVAQFRKGYVHGVKRTARSDYIAATVPVLVYGGGGTIGSRVPESFYAEDPFTSIGPVGDDWGPYNTWRPLGISKHWKGLPLPTWIAVAGEMKNARGCPPIRWKTLVAPGLCPHWGPRGGSLPFSATMSAYAAALMSRPPADLDFVADKISTYSANHTISIRSLGILDLLWAREDLARRGNPHGGTPRGDTWPGPFMELVYGPQDDKPQDDRPQDDKPNSGGIPHRGGRLAPKERPEGTGERPKRVGRRPQRVGRAPAVEPTWHGALKVAGGLLLGGGASVLAGIADAERLRGDE